MEICLIKKVLSGKEENAEKKIRRKLQKRAACVHCHRHGVGRSLLEAGGRGHDLRVEVRGGTEVLPGPRRVRDLWEEEVREPGRRLQSR